MLNGIIDRRAVGIPFPAILENVGLPRFHGRVCPKSNVLLLYAFAVL